MASWLLFLGWGITAPAMEFVPLQQKAQAHSLTGSSQLNDSLYSNPAASSFTQVYSVDGTFQMPKSFAVSILDTKTSTIGGALGYFRHYLPGETASPFQGAKLALAGKVEESVAVGVAGKLIWGLDAQGNDARMHDADFGVLTNFGFIQAGFTIRNIAGGKVDLKQDREWGVGGRVGYQDTLFLSLATTSTAENMKPYQYSIGAEYISPYFIALKGGFRTQPDLHKSYWGAGASFVSPKISFHYAVEFPQQSVEKTEHVVGTTILF